MKIRYQTATSDRNRAAVRGFCCSRVLAFRQKHQPFLMNRDHLSRVCISWEVRWLIRFAAFVSGICQLDDMFSTNRLLSVSNELVKIRAVGYEWNTTGGYTQDWNQSHLSVRLWHRGKTPASVHLDADPLSWTTLAGYAMASFQLVALWKYLFCRENLFWMRYYGTIGDNTG